MTGHRNGLGSSLGRRAVVSGTPASNCCSRIRRAISLLGPYWAPLSLKWELGESKPPFGLNNRFAGSSIQRSTMSLLPVNRPNCDWPCIVELLFCIDRSPNPPITLSSSSAGVPGADESGVPRNCAFCNGFAIKVGVLTEETVGLFCRERGRADATGVPGWESWIFWWPESIERLSWGTLWLGFPNPPWLLLSRDWGANRCEGPSSSLIGSSISISSMVSKSGWWLDDGWARLNLRCMSMILSGCRPRLWPLFCWFCWCAIAAAAKAARLSPWLGRWPPWWGDLVAWDSS